MSTNEKAFIAWPVALKGPVAALTSEAHITLKYLGTSSYTVADLFNRLEGQETRFLVTNMRWEPEDFGDLVYVMALSGVDSALFRTRRALESLREDAFPNWRPHITFPKAAWDLIQEKKLELGDVVRSVGDLTLFINKRPLMRLTP